MKSFRFKLDQALRWRLAQVGVEKAKVASATAVAAGVQLRLEARRTELAATGAQMTKGVDGETLQSWSVWRDRCRRDIAQLEQAAYAAQQQEQLAMKQLVVANQNAKVLDKLKATQLAEWQAQAGRELEAFAGETFLRQVTIGKRTGA